MVLFPDLMRLPVGCRKVDKESRPYPDGRLNLNIAFMAFDDAIGGSKTETGPTTHFLGGKKGIKNSLLNFRRHSGAGVGD